jgi:hypothetical protein
MRRTQTAIRVLLASFMVVACGSLANSADRAVILEQAVHMADRLDQVSTLDRSWYDAPYLVGCAFVAEQLEADGDPRAVRLQRRVEGVVGTGEAVVGHADWAAYAQAAMDLYRLAPSEPSSSRGEWLAATTGPLDFARLVIEYEALDGPPQSWPSNWAAEGYGSRYWQDDLFMMAPWLAMRGSAGSDLPADDEARDLAYEWIEAYAFDHRKTLGDVVDGRVPTLVERRRTGWPLAAPSGRLLYDPTTGLWWHDTDDPGSTERWTRGNGWVALGLARAQRFLDRPYCGGRFAQVVDRRELRRMLGQLARRVVADRNALGIWNADLGRRDLFTEPESSGSALLVAMLAMGVNQGWLDRETFTPVVLKAFHALRLLVDVDGDLHHIQPTAAGPNHGSFYSSDATVDVAGAPLNLDYGVGAFLVAAAEVAQLPATRLAGMESIDTEVVDRERFTVDDGWLTLDVSTLGSFADEVVAADEIAALSDQIVLRAELGDDGKLRVEDRGSGPVHLFVASPNVTVPDEQMVPAIAHLAGAAGTEWRTDVELHNPAEVEQRIELEFVLSGGSHQTERASLAIPAGATAVLDDVVGSVFGAAGKGALRVLSPNAVLVGSQTSTIGLAGRFGQAIPALGRHRALLFGDAARLLMLGGSSRARTNLGCANLSSHSAVVEYALLRSDGAPLLVLRSTIPPRSLDQRHDVLAGLDVDRAYAVVRMLTPGIAVLPYASVVDGLSGDPGLIPPAEEVGAAPPGAPSPPTLVIPAVIHGPGARQTSWRSDLEILNPGGNPTSVALRLIGAADPPVMVELAAGESQTVEDVVATMFDTHGVFAVEIMPRTGSVMALSRTATVGPAGSFGQMIPAMPSGDALRWGDTGVVTQLASGADPMRGARSNIGLVNLAPVPIEVMVAVTDRVGDPLVTLDVVVPASSLRMVNDVFGHLDRDIRGAVARVHTTTPDGVYFAWASVIDGRSGDPVFLAAERLRVHFP